MTTIILVATCIISFLAFQSDELRNRMIFNPYIIHSNRQGYRFISSGLIHADWMHLVINMFVLYSFGYMVEQSYGVVFGEKSTVYFILLYFGGMMMSVLPTYGKHKNDPAYNALGASGAVSSVVFAFILFYPLQPLYLFGILRLPSIIFGVAYLVYCYYAARKGGDHINHDAHFWGALYGVFLTVILKPALLVSFFDQLIYFRHVI
ncbi:MAG: rhomboid family intramembrane serine protease [Bacteroidetes bacterium]|nr:rhomboid family intramembrane serine protease [Bacteroidota bacterium]